MTKSKLDKATIERIYSCTNKKCEGQISIIEPIFGEEFKKVCPFCEKDSLIILRANSGISIIIDGSRPKTLGSLAQKNLDEKIKRDGVDPRSKKENPWWRKDKKVDYNILKNPHKYIMTGEK